MALFTNGRPLTGALLSVITLWSPLWLLSRCFHGSLFTNHLTALAGCCSWVSCAQLCTCSLWRYTPHFYMRVVQHRHLHRNVSNASPTGSLFSLSSSRSRQSTLCSPALWWTCSPSSIRALKSFANWSALIHKSSATIWKDLPRWLTSAATTKSLTELWYKEISHCDCGFALFFHSL